MSFSHPRHIQNFAVYFNLLGNGMIDEMAWRTQARVILNNKSFRQALSTYKKYFHINTGQLNELPFQ
jgi:hypothetical protein